MISNCTRAKARANFFQADQILFIKDFICHNLRRKIDSIKCPVKTKARRSGIKQEGIAMRTFRKVSLLAVTAVLITTVAASALPPVEGRVFSIYPAVNEVSFYKNAEDDFDTRGWTLQVISINGFKLLTNFTIEFTGDFNWEMSYLDRDYYIELSFVKPLAGKLSFNYQRIFSSFEASDINQVGLRLSL